MNENERFCGNDTFGGIMAFPLDIALGIGSMGVDRWARKTGYGGGGLKNREYSWTTKTMLKKYHLAAQIFWRIMFRLYLST